MRRALRLAEQLAEQLLQRADIAGEAPLDVYDAAHRLGAAVITADIPQDGRLITAEGTIVVNASQPEVRQRFTVAHELGHWALRSEPLCTQLARETQDAFSSEEMLCNAVAGAMLMPRDWMQDTFSRAANPDYHTLRLIEEVAQTAEVSLGAAIIRLRFLFAWERTLLQWVSKETQWIFDSEAGVFADEQGLVIPTSATQDVLKAARAESYRRADGYLGVWPLPLIIGNLEDDVPAELLVRGPAAAALIELPRKARR